MWLLPPLQHNVNITIRMKISTAAAVVISVAIGYAAFRVIARLHDLDTGMSFFVIPFFGKCSVLILLAYHLQ